MSRAKPSTPYRGFSVNSLALNLAESVSAWGREESSIQSTRQKSFSRALGVTQSPVEFLIAAAKGAKASRRVFRRDLYYFFFRLSDWRNRINAKKPAPDIQIQKIGSHLPIATSSFLAQRVRQFSTVQTGRRRISFPFHRLRLSRALPSIKKGRAKTSHVLVGPFPNRLKVQPFGRSSDGCVYRKRSLNCQDCLFRGNAFSRSFAKVNRKTRSPDEVLISVCRSMIFAPVIAPTT